MPGAPTSSVPALPPLQVRPSPGHSIQPPPSQQQQQPQQPAKQYNARVTASPAGSRMGARPPHHSSLTDVHAQRVVAVLTEVLNKVDLLKMIPPVMDRRAQNMLGKELASEIEKFNHLKHAITLHSMDDAQAAGIKADLQHAVRNICRHLIHNPDARQELQVYNAHDPNQTDAFLASTDDNERYPGGGDARSVNEMLEVLRQLLASAKQLTVEKLTRSAHDEDSKKVELQRVIEREKKLSEEADQVRTLLERAKRDRIAEINVKNDTIRKLKDELKDIKQTAEDVARKLEMRTKNKDESDHVHYGERETSLQVEIKQLQANLAATIAGHREEELNLRKRRFKVESEVDAWISKYDQDMEEKQAEYDDLSTIYSEEKAQLDDLQSKHDDLNKEYQRILEERKWQEQVRAKLETERTMRIRLIIKIQSLFRGFRIRKQLKEAKDKKKKGGKSGKKKKK